MITALILVFGTSAILNIDLTHKLYRAWLLLNPPPSLGIHRLDPELAQTHIANAKGRHTTGEFDVVYTINQHGNRLTPGAEEGRSIVAILGDSFSFGHGVDDNQTYAAVLQNRHWPSFQVRNRSVMGAGAGHALLALQYDVIHVKTPVKLVIYSWLWFHNGRSYPGKEVLKAALNQTMPRFEIVDGEAVFKGMLHMDDDLSFLPYAKEDIERKQRDTMEALVLAMARICEREGARFVFVILPGKAVDPKHQEAIALIKPFLEKSGIEYLDLHNNPRFPLENRDAFFFKFDHHPNARWHAKVAETLARSIRF